MIVGVLGGGQLGRMLALAGYPLGLEFRFLDPAEQSPTDPLSELIRGEYSDEAALADFLGGGLTGRPPVEVVTYEFENVPAEGRGGSRIGHRSSHHRARGDSSGPPV